MLYTEVLLLYATAFPKACYDNPKDVTAQALFNYIFNDIYSMTNTTVCTTIKNKGADSHSVSLTDTACLTQLLS